jgi:copper chaperone
MTKFSVPDMTCGHCKKAIEEALHKLDAGAQIEIDLDNHIVALTSAAAPDSAIAAIKEAGYTASPL